MILICITGCENSDREPITKSPADRPASRIIALAPHLTELLFTAGAGTRLIGVVDFSDYPRAAAALPRIGDAFRLDYEAIAALEPDLIIGWQSGTPVEVLSRLGDLGYRVVALSSARLDTVAGNLRTIGRLAGSDAEANAAADDYQRALAGLRERYRDAEKISVFYQISARPMMTISRRHIIGEAIELCGGRNIFGSLSGLTPAISIEAVIDRSPEVIMTSSFSADGEALSQWSSWPRIPAVRDGNLFSLNADLIARPSVRILSGVQAICENLELARKKQ